MVFTMQGAIQVLGFTFFTSVSYYVLLNVQLKDLKHSLLHCLLIFWYGNYAFPQYHF